MYRGYQSQTGVEGIKGRKFIVKPRYLIIAGLLLASALIGVSAYELKRSRAELIALLRDQAVSLAESISLSSENAVLSNNEVEDLVAERLLDNARLIRVIDREGRLSGELLQRTAEENGIYSAEIFDRRGTKILSNRVSATSEISDSFLSTIGPILSGESDEIVIGFSEQGFSPGGMFTVAVSRDVGGAIAVSIDSREMLEFRKTIGIGRLIRDIGDNRGIEYVVLQDEMGIISASRGITQMPKIANDPFIQDVLAKDRINSQVAEYDGREIVEVVSPFAIGDVGYGVLRIGLSMEDVRALESEIKLRMVLTTVFIFAAGLGIFAFVSLVQSYSLLRESYRRISSYTQDVLENMADAVVVMDRDYSITVFNRSAENIFGYGTDEVLGKDCRKKLPEICSVTDDVLGSAGRAGGQEIRFSSRDGKKLNLSVSVSTLFDRNGDVEGAIAVIEDLTERKKIEEELNRREKLTAMGELASGMAHEIRNPLNAISVIIQRLEREFEPLGGRDEYLQLARTVRSEISRMNGIVEQFLKLSRPAKLYPMEVDIGDLLKDVALLVEPEANRKGVSLERDLDHDIRASVDVDQIRQAVINLIRNAIDATERGDKIAISARCLEGDVMIDISDTGEGISKENLRRIFDMYFTTKSSGTGLGLSLAHRIVSEHGGRIEVESELAKGSTFRIILPGG